MHENSQVAYSSIAAIRDAHRKLQHKYRERGLAKEILREIEGFIEAARKAGGRIGDEDERWTCQGYLDYWATTLYSHSDNVPNAELESFDEDSAPTLNEADCPYVGLRAFEKEDAALFFGREKDSANLTNLLLRTKPQLLDRIVVVTGPSGSGKSSLIRAGLIPQLQKENLTAGIWQNCVSLVPGAHPRQTQIENGKKLSDGSQQKLLIVDQLEEIFTLCSDEKESESFIDWLISLSKRTNPEVFIVAALSEDFLQQFCMLADQEGIPLYRIEPLVPAKLREVITKPARLRNLQFEPKVVDSLVSDLSAEPTALPLLQFSLMELWKRRKGNRIKHECYLEIGDSGIDEIAVYDGGLIKIRGAKKALEASAERLYKEMSTAGKITFKNILLRLVKLREDGKIAPQRVSEKKLLELADKTMVNQILEKVRKDNTGINDIAPRSYTVFRSKILSESELKELTDRLADKNMVKSVLEKLVETGLIQRIPSGHVEIVHEVLVRNWETLRRWTRSWRVREELELDRELNRATTTWAAHNENTGLLWTDRKQLERLKSPGILWRAEPSEKEFLEKSQIRAQHLRWLKLIAFSTLFLIGALLLGYFAYQQRASELKYAKSGIKEILVPFKETWGLQVEYDSIDEIRGKLPKDVILKISRHSNNNDKNKSFPRSVREFYRLDSVQGQKGECAIVRLTRRRHYNEKQGWAWSGFTTDFKYPGKPTKIYIELFGNAAEKTPRSLSIDFTQYSLKNESEKRLVKYPVTFVRNGDKYKGRLVSPILKDSIGNGIPFATIWLKQLPDNSKACPEKQSDENPAKT